MIRMTVPLTKSTEPRCKQTSKVTRSPRREVLNGIEFDAAWRQLTMSDTAMQSLYAATIRGQFLTNLSNHKGPISDELKNERFVNGQSLSLSPNTHSRESNTHSNASTPARTAGNCIVRSTQSNAEVLPTSATSASNEGDKQSTPKPRRYNSDSDDLGSRSEALASQTTMPAVC